MKLEDIDMEAAEKYENDKFNAIIEYINLQLENIDFDESKYNKEKMEYEKKLQYEKEHDIENKLEMLLNLNLEYVRHVASFYGTLTEPPMLAQLETTINERLEYNKYRELYNKFIKKGGSSIWDIIQPEPEYLSTILKKVNV